jgi:hypothetical protein
MYDQKLKELRYRCKKCGSLLASGDYIKFKLGPRRFLDYRKFESCYNLSLFHKDFWMSPTAKEPHNKFTKSRGQRISFSYFSLSNHKTLDKYLPSKSCHYLHCKCYKSSLDLNEDLFTSKRFENK